MIKVLPIRLLTEEDAPIFGGLNVALGNLERLGLPVASGVVVTAPNLKFRTVLEHFDFGSKEIFEQSLTLVKKEINSTPVPEILANEIRKHRQFFLDGVKIKGIKVLWLALLRLWLEQIEQRIWKDGFYKGITEGLDSYVVAFVKKMEAFGRAYFDPLQDDVVINVKSGCSLHPNDLKKIVEIVKEASKKLFIPHEYEWILDRGVKLAGLKPYTPSNVILASDEGARPGSKKDSGVGRQGDLPRMTETKSAVKVFFDLSAGFTIEKNVDGVYIASEKIFDLNKPNDSFEQLVFRLVESAVTFPDSPILFKLADMSEGFGKVRGTLRLLHQKSLFEPLVEALDFVRHKKGLTNVSVVVPFVRTTQEFLQIKRDLAVKKFTRKNSFKLWLEVAVPENVVNLEDYLLAGLDGVVLNLDELVAHLNGFDPSCEELMFYKNEVSGLIKFLEDGLKLLNKSKVPFIACGNLSLYPKILEFLVEKGVYGVVVENYETHSAKDLLYQTERRMILRRVF